MKAALYAFLVLVGVSMLPVTAYAVNPSEMLDDPVLEARARDISVGLRCVVCQNQSIDDSNAELARDLRILVRERLTSGDSDQDVLDYVVSRYGDYVLLSPPVKASTYALWFGPLIFVLFGIGAIVMLFRKRKGAILASPNAPRLSADEERRLKKLLDSDL